MNWTFEEGLKRFSARVCKNTEEGATDLKMLVFIQLPVIATIYIYKAGYVRVRV